MTNVPTRMDLAEAEARFSAVVDEVRHGGKRYLVMRHGKPAAAIVSVEDLERLDAFEALDPTPIGALALVGAWGDVSDQEIDEFLEEIYRSRAEDMGPIPTM